jgi:hypothetical protein
MLFYEKLPIFGKVPMLFFMPENSPEINEIRELIILHGGIEIYIPEGGCYQILRDKVK